ncbi:imidazolonepropionase [Sinorhizobium numidicum]|uniref:Imidazolonepropionase n=2 Tax=Sinorhizobium numidicum TaxID=680248 RepID=A0ABY8CRN0_9HYPH|nr:imidazolonepropionase [Sinorhizobium numidicum]WEX75309.1 imidazolonepropionase [Sinorhizobium numidicum]WEX81304.1 imidazolonepropionase [Sinorhizobium numidicum]
MGGSKMSETKPARTSLWRNVRLATLREDFGPLGVIEKGAVAVHDGRIAFAGAESDLPANLTRADQVVDCESRWMTPALIDCHTHIVHGGNRAREFQLRLEGASYEEIARAGGGIVSTVKATNALSVDELVQAALPRLDALLSESVSTVEIKSGYGLNIEAELKMLRAARQLQNLRPVRIVTSYLAAHATPPEYKGRNADYIADVVLPGLTKAHAEGLVDAVDGFCEGIAFSPAEIALVFNKAKALGLPVKLHAEQLSDLGGAKLAASYGALSADHLEYLDPEGAAVMAKAGTVAVLLPGAFYTLRETQLPPVGALRAAGTRIAIATDCNPGTSPLTSLLLTMNMSATLFRLTLEECLAGVTREAAGALGILKETGTIEAGKFADLALWNIDAPAELIYRIGFNPLHERIFKGERIPR